MGHVRRILLCALPKLLLSRTTGLLTRTPLPIGLRPAVYRCFARCYGVDLGEVAGELQDYPSLAAFFARPLGSLARPIQRDAPLLWPCDGRVVSSGPLRGDRIEQLKGVDYGLQELVVDPELAGLLAGGSQATVYLAPRDYHRVHAPFRAELLGQQHVPGSLFPVNPLAVRSIPSLFARNERVVFRFRLPDGRAAALVMVAALNVGDIRILPRSERTLGAGEELAAFGFGSTTVVLLAPGSPRIGAVPHDTVVRVGQAIPIG